jgi:predicted nuclease with RNAse H fold
MPGQCVPITRCEDRFVRTLGIDLSSDTRATGACVIEWARGHGEIEELRPAPGTREGLDDEALLELIGRADMVGIDAPFGWPIGFVSAVSGWRDGEVWPQTVDEELQLRVTDRFVADHLGAWAEEREIRKPRRPLSVSTNLIGVTAMRCARLLDQLPRSKVRRSGVGGKVAEVYPAAALFRWGFPAEGYKGKDGRETRLELVERLGRALRQVCPLEGARRKACEEDDDALDALVAAFIARAVATRRTIRPRTREQRSLAAIEGWIHLPDCELAELG